MRTLLICALFLAGCGTLPEVVEGNSESVIVNWGNTWSRSGTLDTAERHCAKFGRVAKYHTDVDRFRVAYDCVKPTK